MIDAAKLATFCQNNPFPTQNSFKERLSVFIIRQYVLLVSSDMRARRARRRDESRLYSLSLASRTSRSFFLYRGRQRIGISSIKTPFPIIISPGRRSSRLRHPTKTPTHRPPWWLRRSRWRIQNHRNRSNSRRSLYHNYFRSLRQ